MSTFCEVRVDHKFRFGFITTCVPMPGDMIDSPDGEYVYRVKERQFVTNELPPMDAIIVACVQLHCEAP